MSLFPAEHETIAGVGRSLRTGRTTCIEVLNKCLDRIAEWEGRVKAWVVVDRECATKQSIALDRELAEGQCRGPLHGIPFGIKDIINVKDLPTGCGFEPFRNRYPDHDAPLVSALRSSGAVILGKTVTTQFAWIDPPPTRNPWDLTRTPGGSSSGSAVAVALGMCLGALGSQTGGSIIRPASFCGIAGYKPQYKALSDDGIHSLAPSFDHPGLMARSICDVRLIMTELVKHQFDVGEDIGDRLTRTESVGTTRDQPPRLLRPRGLFDRRAEPMMLDRFESTLERLVAAGAEVVEKDDPLDFETILTEHRLIMAAQAFAVHEYSFTWLVNYIDNKTTPEDAQFSGALERVFSPRIRSLVEEGFKVPLGRYIRAKHQLDDMRRLSPKLVEGFDAIVTPATIGPAPDTSTTGNPCFNSPFSYLGWPAASFPIGLSPEGLPLAIQLAGPEYRGAKPNGILDTAAWCENVIRNASRAGSH